MKKISRLRHTLLLVDDEPSNLHLLRYTLQDDYRLLFAKDGCTAWDLVLKERPDLILLDIMMPGVSGYDVCRKIKSDPRTTSIPIIFVTALTESSNEQQGLELGAVDYISKPFNPHIVRARVRTHLSLVQSVEVMRTRLQIIQCLGKAAEYKDNETGLHVIRMSHFASALARAVGYSEDGVDELFHAAPMHDVGKIGIPDAILQKPGKLTEEEWVTMRQHTIIGARIIGDHPSGLLKTAATIALNHHEKWDGSGYPNGLAGEDIPHVARVVALADVFDALTCVRPYKRAWSAEEALDFIIHERGQHFDPELVDAFLGCLSEIFEIQNRWGDSE
ncbi:response regulator [Pseudomonas aeruginosa]|uniref:response regulator n=1 Tax=Pseudomonas aeruginosa TaxID=287 RepID=UPI0034D193C0